VHRLCRHRLCHGARILDELAMPGEELDMTEPPSEAFDRHEVIVLMGESHTGQKCRSGKIV
jgi:hypothetical protein